MVTCSEEKLTAVNLVLNIEINLVINRYNLKTNISLTYFFLSTSNLLSI